MDASDERFQHARKRLVAELESKGIRDRRVLDAIGSVPRHRFVDSGFVHLAYEDQALPIGHGQTVSQPYIVAFMTELLIADGVPEVVLEVGTGSGYQTAVLSLLAPRVFTIERIGALHKAARKLLVALDCRNVNFRCADGGKGWEKFAPFGGVIVTAVSREPPPALLEQLAVGGRMVVPVGERRQQLTLISRDRRGYKRKRYLEVKFVPLIGSGRED